MQLVLQWYLPIDGTKVAIVQFALWQNNNIIIATENLLVVIVEQGGKHEAPSSLDCEHVFALRWASSSLKQTSTAWEGTCNATVVSMHKS